MTTICQELTASMQARSRLHGTRRLINSAQALEIVERHPHASSRTPEERTAVWIAERLGHFADR